VTDELSHLRVLIPSAARSTTQYGSFQVAFDCQLPPPPQRDALSAESEHAERCGLRFIWNGIGQGCTGAKILVIVRLSGLASLDGLAHDGFIGVAG
jgi:hypothetical protein